MNHKNYFYDRNKNSVLYFHPVMTGIMSQDGKTRNMASGFSKKINQYYLNKYRLLKRNGFLKTDYQIEKADCKPEQFNRALIDCRHLTFEVTEDCNLNCLYCGFGDLYTYKKANKKSLSFKNAKALIDFMVKIWNKKEDQDLRKSIKLSFYGGEPLLNFPLIKQIVEYAKQIKLNFNEFCFGMTTNGVLLDKYIDYLVENDFYLSISLDGNKEHNAYRVFKNNQPSFNKIEDNILKIKRVFPDYFINRVNFLSVIHNKNSIEEVYQYFQKFNKRTRILALSKKGLNKAKLEVFDKIFADVKTNISENTVEMILKNDPFFDHPMAKRTKMFLERALHDVFSNKAQLLQSRKKIRKNYTSTCIPLSSKIFLSVDGNLYPCEKTFFVTPVGRISGNKVQIDFTGVHKEINRSLNILFSQCQTCHLSAECPVCLFLINVENSDFICPEYVDKEKFYDNMAEILGYLEKHPEFYKEHA